MPRSSSTSPRRWPLLFSLLLAGCASAPRAVDHRFSPEYVTATDGRLRYRLPEGWLNATKDSPSATDIVWLVRSDFAATLSVRELKVDAEARREINRGGLMRLAELTLALESGERGIHIAREPQSSSTRGKSVCMYEYVTGQPTNRIRVLLVDTGTTVYEVSVLMKESVSREPGDNIAAMQDLFIQNLGW